MIIYIANKRFSPTYTYPRRGALSRWKSHADFFFATPFWPLRNLWDLSFETGSWNKSKRSFIAPSAPCTNMKTHTEGNRSNLVDKFRPSALSVFYSFLLCRLAHLVRIRPIGRYARPPFADVVTTELAKVTSLQHTAATHTSLVGSGWTRRTRWLIKSGSFFRLFR